MSFSMWLGRVLLPAFGLGIVGLLGWQAYRTGRLELPIGTDQAKPTQGSLPTRQAIRATVIAEGRVVAYPGAEVVVGAEVAGTISRVLVGEKSRVHKGDPVVEFRVDEAHAEWAEASSRCQEVEAEVTRLEAEQRRLAAVPATDPESAHARQRATHTLLDARSHRDVLKATRARLEVVWRKHRILAPIDGVVTTRSAQPGETIALGAPLLTIVDLNRLRVEAEVDDFDVARCREGDRARVGSEGYPGRIWSGVVEEISDTLVSRRTRPEDPARPTDTRVLPIRIAIDGPHPLRLGQRVEVELGIPATAPGTWVPGSELPTFGPTARPVTADRAVR